MKKVIIMIGGSFNPPTNAHFSLAQAIIDEYDEVDKVLFIPVGNHYDKPGLEDSRHRVNMLKSVTDSDPRMGVDLTEVNSPFQYKTVETLDILKDKYPEHDIWFAIGSDNLWGLDKWLKADELLDRYKLLVIERDGDRIEDIINNKSVSNFYDQNSRKNNLLKANEYVTNPLSSTLMRNKLKRGKSVRFLVPESVISIIEKQGLYRDE